MRPWSNIDISVRESRKGQVVRIGELSRRTNVPARLLRYYEQQGLLSPDRAANGYRDYAEALVDRVTQIRGLIEAGVPTRIIGQILPCLDNPCSIHVPDATPDIIAALEAHHARMDARINCLARNRDAIARYLDAVRQQVNNRSETRKTNGDKAP